MDTLKKILESIENEFSKVDKEKYDCENMYNKEGWYKVGNIRGQLAAYDKCLDIIQSCIENASDINKWNPISQIPELQLEEEHKTLDIYSAEVLIQTKNGDMFVGKCKKFVLKDRDKEDTEWFSYGTGGRQMCFKSKPVAWQYLPEEYKGE